MSVVRAASISVRPTRTKRLPSHSMWWANSSQENGQRDFWRSESVMKTIVSLGLMVGLVLGNSLLCPAQTPANCDQLRDKISQLEQSDMNAMSPSIRQLYKESLLKVYAEFSQCLEQDISATANMRSAVDGTSAAPAVEAKLSSLRKEKRDTDNKITVLRIALNRRASEPNSATGTSGPSSPETPDGDPNGPNKTDRTASSTPSTKTNPTTPTAPTGQANAVCANVLPGEDYADPPTILSDIANKAAADVVRRQDPVRAIFPLTQMVLYTVFDAASPNSSKMVRGLGAYQYLSETARTDKQLGSSANSDGAVSAIEKPSFARLLGFAVEHGGITKKNDGTNLTLSTSLYSLYAMSGGDTAETYQRAGVLNRIGVSATFAVDNQTNDLANARRNNLNQWSVKARLFGDRSTRAPGFQKFWNEKVRPLISERLQSLGSAVESLSTKLDSYDGIERASRRCLPDQVKKRMGDADYVAATDDAKKKIVSDLILSHLRSNVFNQVKTGTLKLDDKEVADIEQVFLPRLKSSLDNLVLADAEVKKQIDNLQKGPLGTFAYTNYRVPAGSDYS